MCYWKWPSPSQDLQLYGSIRRPKFWDYRTTETADKHRQHVPHGSQVQRLDNLFAIFDNQFERPGNPFAIRVRISTSQFANCESYGSCELKFFISCICVQFLCKRRDITEKYKKFGTKLNYRGFHAYSHTHATGNLMLTKPTSSQMS